MRKIALLLTTLLLVFGAVQVFAQDATPEPTPAPAAQQPQVPGFIGLDIFNRAAQDMQAQNPQQAITDYSLFILLNPTGSQAYFQRAFSYTQINDLTSALADLTHALALPAATPQLTARIYALRAAIYLIQSDNDKALADLNAGIEADATLPSLFLQRGRLYSSQNNFADALTDFSKFIELSPTVPDGYALRAIVNIQLQKYDDALADYNQLIVLSPNDSSVLTSRARLYIQQKEYEPALADLNDAIRLDPSSAGLLLLRGSVNNELGNHADAAKDYVEWVRSQQTVLDTSLSLRPGESQVVQLAAGKFYIFNYQGKAGQKVTLTASARPGESTDPLLVLVTNDATPLAGDDDGGGNFDAAITDYTLPADGLYGIVVGYSGGGTDGAVRVLLNVAQ